MEIISYTTRLPSSQMYSFWTNDIALTKISFHFSILPAIPLHEAIA